MIVGHYATALLPWSRLKGEGCPFWLVLLCSQVPEFLWLALALAGLEAPEPANLLDATFSNLRVDMIYSHNLAPALAQAAIVGALVWGVWRKPVIAGWCAILTFAHVLCDYLVGFEHQVLGRDSMSVGLNSYARWPYAAIVFELAFSVACIAWYHRCEERAGRPVARGRKIALYVAFAVGILAWMPNARVPMRAMFQ